MNIVEIRRELHHFIDSMDDERATAIYTLFEDSIVSYSDEFKAELDKRMKAYEGDGILIDQEAVDAKVKSIINKSR